MREHIKPAVLAILVWTVLMGGVYTLLVTGIARRPSRARPTAA
jgi:K+-transporting ATPase c subunit